MSEIRQAANDPLEGYEPAKALTSISSWIRRTVEAGQVITPEKALAWADAFDAAASKASAREDQLYALQVRGADRVSARGADIILAACLVALTRLTDHAQQAATFAELKEIERDVTSLVNGLESLALGVSRSTQPTNGDDHAG